MLILYSLPFSNYSAKVAIALNIKGIDHEKRPPPGGYSSPEYMSIVPSGTIPGIDDEGAILSESDVINEYLEDKWPEPTLLHGDAELRGRQRFLSRFHDFMVEPNLRALFPHLTPSQRDSAFVDEKLDAFNRQVARLETLVDLIHPLILLSNDTKDFLEYPLLHKHLQKPLHQWTDSLIRPVGNMVIQHQPLTKQRVRSIFHRVRL